MFTLISRLPIRELLYRQAPTLFGALVIAIPSGIASCSRLLASCSRGWCSTPWRV